MPVSILVIMPISMPFSIVATIINLHIHIHTILSTSMTILILSIITILQIHSEPSNTIAITPPRKEPSSLLTSVPAGPGTNTPPPKAP
ncbi:hypothetical protein KCU88_g2844, partial [Aureobasidium melanogenum]